MHEYKEKPWHILVQWVHKMIGTAQWHFTGSMVVNWTPSSLYLESSAKFHVIICFGVGFLLLGCGVGVHVVFLGFLSEYDPEDPTWKLYINHEERQKMLELAGEHSDPLPAALWLACQNCCFPCHWPALCCNSRQPAGISSVCFIPVETASSKKAMEKTRDSQIRAICNPYQERLRIILYFKEKSRGSRLYPSWESSLRN